MNRRRLLGLAVSIAALAVTAAPAGAAPIHPAAHDDQQIIAVLIGLEAQPPAHSSDLTMPGSSTWGSLTSRSAPAGFKSLSGMDSETEFMDYTDDVMFD